MFSTAGGGKGLNDLFVNYREPVPEPEAEFACPKRQPLIKTYIFKAILAELNHKMKKHKSREPEAPHHHFFHCLNIQHTKNEDELVENEIPEFILEML